MLSYNVQTENAPPTEWLPDGTTQTYLERTRSPEAWDVTFGDWRPIVAVVDNNINIFNYDLQENIFLNRDEIPTSAVRGFRCGLLADPIPLITEDRNGDGNLTVDDMDIDADGIITLADLNQDPNLSNYRAALAARGQAIPAVLGLEHLLVPEPPVPTAERDTALDEGLLRCGLWEDLVDGPPANGLVDDIAGWDFVVDRNVPLSSIPSPGAGPLDGSGHGHAVAGTLAAANNALSVFPEDRLAVDYVGQTWRARILAVRVGTQDAPAGFPEGEPFGDQGVFHDGLRYAVDLDADIVNMSFSLICTHAHIDGVPDDFICPDFTDKTEEYRQAFALAELEQTLVVVGPINQPISLDSEDVLDLPAELQLPTQLNVGSVDLADAYRKDVVSFGAGTYHIAAPSQDMPVLNFGGRGSIVPGEETSGIESELVAGNSLAAPQVSGAAALILSRSPDLRGQPILLRRRILDNAAILDDLRAKVEEGRRLDVFRAVRDQ